MKNLEEEITKKTRQVITFHENFDEGGFQSQKETCYTVNISTNLEEELYFLEEKPIRTNARAGLKKFS